MCKISKGAASLVTGLAVAAAAAMATTIPAEAAARCSVTFQTYHPIKKGSTGAQAKAMECPLAKAGYATTVNGRFSAADARELAKFRKSIGRLNPLAVGGRRAWSALLARGTTPRLEQAPRQGCGSTSTGAASAGFAKMPTTGRYNAATVAVVTMIQKSSSQTDRRSERTLRKTLQAGKITASTVVANKPATKPASSTNSTKGEKALAYAKKQLGDPYARQGTGPNGWDCSGLTMKAWQAAGVRLPHSAGQQYRIGKKISKSNLRNGDLVFFIAASHMWGSMQATARSFTHRARASRCPTSR